MGWAVDFRALGIEGLKPRAWVCVGSGYSREDVKEEIFRQGVGFVGQALTTPEELAARVLGVERARILGKFSRQEVLRQLLSQVIGRLPALREMRRQGRFYRKLDRAIQAGRGMAASRDELGVILARAEEVSGPQPLRSECTWLEAVYDEWLRQQEFYDGHRILREAAERIECGAAEVGDLPSTIHWLRVAGGESSVSPLEAAFFEALARVREVRALGPSGADSVTSAAQESSVWVRWVRHHTLDDAADAIAGTFRANIESLEESAVLIPDEPGVRRSLRRAAVQAGLALADPRDPTWPKRSEGIKMALLPLAVVARRFERSDVLSWFGRRGGSSVALDAGAARILMEQAAGPGLATYSHPKLAAVRAELERLQVFFGGRRTVDEMARRHLELLHSEPRLQDALDPRVPPFFESLWDGLREDLDRFGMKDRRAPPLLWLERLRERIDEAPPEIARFAPRTGIALYRLSQGRVGRDLKTLYLLGLPPDWFEGERVGDYWFSERDRELLAADFPVRTRKEVARERVRALREWASMASGGEIVVCDALHGWDGAERESASGAVTRICEDLGVAVPEPTTGEPRRERLVSFDLTAIQAPPVEVRLTAPTRDRELKATELDQYSRCAFRALPGYRWRLDELEDPDVELWVRERGTLLHRAAKLLVKEGLSPREAVDRAWELSPPRGIVRSARAREHARERLTRVMARFAEQEAAYRERSGTRPLWLDDRELTCEVGGVRVRGRPDRVDETPDGGLFVLDYKTGGDHPQGVDTRDLGYGLQLPFYAIAAGRETGRPVLGAQFVELSRGGGRARGVLFKEFNGKDPGKLTHSRSKKSVLETGVEETWARCEEWIARHAGEWARGVYDARPKFEEDCETCPASDVCGARRRARP